LIDDPVRWRVFEQRPKARRRAGTFDEPPGFDRRCSHPSAVPPVRASPAPRSWVRRLQSAPEVGGRHVRGDGTTVAVATRTFAPPLAEKYSICAKSRPDSADLVVLRLFPPVPFFPNSQMQPLGDLRDPSPRVAYLNLLPSPRKALLRAYRAAWKQLKSIAQLSLATPGGDSKIRMRSWDSRSGWIKPKQKRQLFVMRP